MTSNLFAHVEMAPRDPILGVTEAFVADKNPKKVNLGVGIYYDDTGRVPVLACVRRAEHDMAEKASARAYLPIDGLAAYNKAIQTLVFGADSPALKDNRIVTVQTLGGTGGLKVGADFLRRLLPDAQVWISEPSWENHRALFEYAGFVVNSYPYYEASTHGVNFNGMIDSLGRLHAGSIVVLHACCHNPTGVDLTPDQWAAVIEIVNKRGLVPLLDLAYQGLGDGLDADAASVRLFAKAGGPAFVSNSFSKTFSLYGERVGGLSLVAENADHAARSLSQIKRLVRTNYSNPPIHGSQIVAAVLSTPETHALWEQELGHMRERIREVRQQLVEQLRAKTPKHDFSFVIRQRGMFSYSGLSKRAVARLREEFSVYVIDTGRICVAAINSKNIDYVSDAIARVVA